MVFGYAETRCTRFQAAYRAFGRGEMMQQFIGNLVDKKGDDAGLCDAV